jgi:hypothetical protein
MHLATLAVELCFLLPLTSSRSVKWGSKKWRRNAVWGRKKKKKYIATVGAAAAAAAAGSILLLMLPLWATGSSCREIEWLCSVT